MTWHMANHCPGDAPGAVELHGMEWYGMNFALNGDMTNGESWVSPLPVGTSLTKGEPEKKDV